MATASYKETAGGTSHRHLSRSVAQVPPARPAQALQGCCPNETSLMTGKEKKALFSLSFPNYALR